MNFEINTRGTEARNKKKRNIKNGISYRIIKLMRRLSKQSREIVEKFLKFRRKFVSMSTIILEKNLVDESKASTTLKI